ncbi:tripartite tricarboxylate transporter substrate binding protein [Ramlibacter sp.]|uniref:tripartite tricarboxylate transporter substrate binding protein n=1 Tax=Ramlibacter sp. TaxID=1917967 RepID=UPI002618C66C|nr:tripartite tricarboxylate transporter substrate binding protein [Ramlibacter sp.]MDB5954042.1 putative secreted protein [Ramlibacter sp.]
MLIPRRRLGALAAALACGLGLGAPAAAQNYPSRTVRLIVPYSPGGANDVLARLFANLLSSSFGQPVIVENHPGAGGNIGSEMVARAAPDGYTLLYVSNSLAIAPALYPKMNYSLQQLAPISLVADFPIALVTSASIPAHNVKELVALSKKKSLNYGSTGIGSANHLTGVLLNSVAGVNNVHVPYKGAGPMMVALLGGEIDFAAPNVFTAVPYLHSDRVHILAVTGSKPSSALPGVPTVGRDYPGFDTDVWHGFFTTAGTPAPVVARLHEEIIKALHSPQMRDALEKGGGETVGDTPEEFARVIASDGKKYAKLVKISGATAD